MADILKAADWSSETGFTKFYNKPLRSVTFGEALILSNTELQNTTVAYVRLSLLKHNCRMAEPTQWAPAILDTKRSSSSPSSAPGYRTRPRRGRGGGGRALGIHCWTLSQTLVGSNKDLFPPRPYFWLLWTSKCVSGPP